MDLDTDPLYRGASRIVRSPHRRTIVFTITAEPDPAAAPNWDHRFVDQPKLGVGIIHDSPWSSQDAWGSLVGATTSEKPRSGGMSTTFPGPLLSVEDLGSWYEAVAQADPTLDIDGPSGTIPTAARNRVRAAQFADGVLTPVVHEVLPLVRAADAHRAMDDGAVFGRIVLVPGPA